MIRHVLDVEAASVSAKMSKKEVLTREQQALAKLLELPENKLCADCGVKGADATQTHSASRDAAMLLQRKTCTFPLIIFVG